MFSCCQTSTARGAEARLVEYKVLVYEHQERDARVTAFVLGFLALFLFGAAAILFGMGTLSPTFLMGLGMFPYLGGVILSFMSLGILCATFIYVVIASVRSCQKENRKDELYRLQKNP
jgi:hypothetical protein